MQKKIKRHLTSTENILKAIKKTELSFSETKAQEIIANTLKIIKENIEIYPALKDNNYETLLEEYKSLVLNYQKLKTDKKNYENDYRAYVFPGMGETKDINSEGDYYIFDEMLELSKEIKKDIIFLTNDTTKADWLESKSGKNYIHYQTVFYMLSKQGIKVRNFDEYISADLGIKTEKLLETEVADYDEEFMGNFLVKWSNIEKKFNELLLQNGVKTERQKPIREVFLDIKVRNFDRKKFLYDVLTLPEFWRNLHLVSRKTKSDGFDTHPAAEINRMLSHFYCPSKKFSFGNNVITTNQKEVMENIKQNAPFDLYVNTFANHIFFRLPGLALPLTVNEQLWSAFEEPDMEILIKRNEFAEYKFK